MIATDFPYAERLLKYYAKSGRRLPWRGTNDPYRIWVAEIMLQQTGVATVTGYYDRFLQRFPTVVHLSQASLDEVRRAWQGLGYYRRAENLHRAARIIHEDRADRFPDTLEGWLVLPGIGRSTAAAILAIGWNQRHAILDGNCKRVLSRLMALEEPVNTSAGERSLWREATRITPVDRPGDYAQAIMDLGATVCVPKEPRCHECPWSEGCRARMNGSAVDFPQKRKREAVPRFGQVAVLVQGPGESVLMQRRPEGGLLSGLWQPVSLERQDFSPRHPEHSLVATAVAQRFAITCRDMVHVGAVQHRFTHFHLTVWVYSCVHEGGWPREEEVIWWSLDRGDLPMSTLHRKVIAFLSINDKHQGEGR
ncbi:MAG: A/G-specific adenine glycosylase [Magnetococcales bacterium]|nr:A/G-specific adenine glycosylase [Magnetococcales bacterium]